MASNVDENDSLPRKRRAEMNVAYSGVPTGDSDTDQDEKPWQQVPCKLLIVLLGWYLLLGYLTQMAEDSMPMVVNEDDLAMNNTLAFSEGTAWRYLRNILGDEARVAGTAYHLNKTVDMKAMVDEIAARASQRVSTDWQIESGDYFKKTATPFVSVYANASNIIALLEGESGFHKNGTIGTSVLVNCHYDSVPYALGASDNAVFCAAMMEILSKFSKSTRKFKNNIVFLFNGAEEMGLLASHGFLKHPWAKGVTTVVNLDAAGMNGKPSVFQVTDPRLLRAYQRAVRRPSAQGMGEFLFTSGIIPSDTDFRVFRDFGGIQGIDIAFTKWGQVYHTRYDHPDLILPGVIQNAGDMLLALLQELGDMEELDTKMDPPRSAVYFDYLNLLMVTYSYAAAYAVDVAILLLASLSVAYYVWFVGPRMSTVKELLLAVAGRGAALLAGVVAVLVPAYVMIATTSQLRYLSEPWILVPLFWIPYLIGAVAVSEAFDAWRTKKSGLNRSIRALQAMAATRLSLLVLLLVMLCIKRVQSVRYLLSAPLLIMSVSALLALTVVKYVRMQAWQHLLLQVALSTPATIFTFTVALRLDAAILPVMGRSSSDTPDNTVAFLNIALVVLASATVSGVELLFSRRRLWLPLAAVGAACLVIMFTPFPPFRDEGPSTQRHYWLHSEIVTYDSSQQPAERTSGVTVLKLDAYTAKSVAPLVSHVPSTDRHDCETRVYCNLPLYRTSFAKHLSQAVFVYMEGPAPFSPPPSLTATRRCLSEICTYSFQMIGAPHNTLTLWPRAHVNVSSWSLLPPPAPAFHQLSRPVYTVVHTRATYHPTAPTYNFTVTCIIPVSLQSQTAMDVSHHSHKIYHPEDFTEGYQKLLNSAPKYFNVASTLSFRHNYVF